MFLSQSIGVIVLYTNGVVTVMEEIEVRQIFADNLKRLRKQKGLSQLKLSNEMQMAFTFINDIENCKKWVSPETLARFATFFNVPVSTFFSTDEENADSVIQASFVNTVCDEVVKTIKNVEERFNKS